MNLKLCLQLILLYASISPHVISARDLFHTHEYPRFSFPQHLVGSRKGHNTGGIKIIKTYLQRYGYLCNNVNITDDNVFDANLELALKTYQNFFKLNVSGILDARTLEEMSKPRCGVPDVFHEETGKDHSRGLFFAYFPGAPKWFYDKYNLTYALINNFPHDYRKAVNDAIATWEMKSRFKFNEVGENEDNYDIRVSFEVGDHGDGQPFEPDVLAHAFSPEDGRLHLNGAIPWFDGAYPGRYDVYTVALHEMGHILGLSHSQVENAIMFPTIDANTIKYIQEDDVDGLWGLYQEWGLG